MSTNSFQDALKNAAKQAAPKDDLPLTDTEAASTPATEAEADSEVASEVASKPATAAQQIVAGMTGASVGIIPAPVETAPQIKSGYSSVHVSTIDGVKGTSYRGRFLWAKDLLDSDSERLQALLSAGRVTEL